MIIKIPVKKLMTNLAVTAIALVVSFLVVYCVFDLMSSNIATNPNVLHLGLLVVLNSYDIISYIILFLVAIFTIHSFNRKT